MSTRSSGLLLLVLLSLLGCRREASPAPAPPPPAADTGPKGTPTVSVAAASDLKFAFDELVRDFEKTSPATKVTVTYGRLGKFFAQVVEQSPVRSLPLRRHRLPAEAHRAGARRRRLGVPLRGRARSFCGSGTTSALDLEQAGATAVLDPSVRKVAIANPEHAS